MLTSLNHPQVFVNIKYLNIRVCGVFFRPTTPKRTRLHPSIIEKSGKVPKIIQLHFEEELEMQVGGKDVIQESKPMAGHRKIRNPLFTNNWTLYLVPHLCRSYQKMRKLNKIVWKTNKYFFLLQTRIHQSYIDYEIVNTYKHKS